MRKEVLIGEGEGTRKETRVVSITHETILKGDGSKSLSEHNSTHAPVRTVTGIFFFSTGMVVADFCLLLLEFSLLVVFALIDFLVIVLLTGRR